MAATTIPPGTPPNLDLSGDARRHRRERAIGVVFFAAAALSVVVSAAIVLSLFGKGWEFIAQRRVGRRDHGRHLEPPPERLRHPAPDRRAA